MHGETQANRLAQLLQQQGNLPHYELALPLVTVRSSSLKRLDVNSVLLLGLRHLECVLMDESIICATVVLTKLPYSYVMKILAIEKDPIAQHESKKSEMIKLSFGKIQSRTLCVGHTIDVSQVNLEKVTLVYKEKKIATASLINVDGEIAVRIDKVEKIDKVEENG